MKKIIALLSAVAVFCQMGCNALDRGLGMQAPEEGNGHENEPGLVDLPQDVHENIYDYLNGRDLSDFLTSNRETSGEVVNYASMLRNNMQNICDSAAPFTPDFFENSDALHVRLLADDDNFRLPARFIEDFWQSEPSHALLVQWLNNSPSSKLLLRRYVGLDGDYPGALLCGEQLIHKISNLPTYRSNNRQDSTLEETVQVLEALVEICARCPTIKSALYNTMKTSTLRRTALYQIVEQRGDLDSRRALKRRVKEAMENMGGSSDPDFEQNWDRSLRLVLGVIQHRI